MPVTLAPSTSPTSPAPSSSSEPEVPFDWTLWELDEEEDMGHSPEHHRITSEVESLLREWVMERGWTDAFVCSDTFFAWVPDQPNVRVSPDVYFFRGVPSSLPASWQTWRAGHPPPTSAFEVVSEDRTKEYAVNPAKYDALGATELIIYDPRSAGGSGVGPIAYYRRAARGRLEAVSLSATAIYSDALEVWLVAREGSQGPSLRLSRDSDGRSLVPTTAERADIEAAGKKQALGLAEQERAEKEHERTEKEQALMLADQERTEKEHERTEKEHQRAEKEQALMVAERERAEKEQERAEKEQALMVAEQERAEKEHALKVAEQERAEKEQERAQKEKALMVAERERTENERERSLRAALEAELAALRASNARNRQGG